MMEQYFGALVARLLYFLGTMIVLPVTTVLLIALGTGRTTTHLEGVASVYQRTVLSSFPVSVYWGLVIGTAIFAFCFGPALYCRRLQRGRGTLDKIREESRMDRGS